VTRAALPRVVLRRVVRTLPVLLGIATLNFIILHLAPGDVVDVLAGESGASTPEYMAALRHEFGLDLPLYEQFLRYLTNLLQLHFGFSYRQNQPVLNLFIDRLPATLLLMLTAMALAIVIGTLLGMIAARRPHSWLDHGVSVLVLISYAVPSFWFGLMAIVVFSVHLHWLPSGGMVTIGANLSGPALLLDLTRHLVLPASTLAIFYLAVYARLVRGTLLQLHGAEFIRAARAKGAGEWRVAINHALRNVLAPLATMAGFQLASLLSGAVLVESVFSWPGLGRLAFDAILARDFNLLLGVLFISSVLVTLLNMGTDALCVLLDPRMERLA